MRKQKEGVKEKAAHAPFLNILISSLLQEILIFLSLRGRPATARSCVGVGMLRTYLCRRLIVVLLHFLGSATVAVHNHTLPGENEKALTFVLANRVMERTYLGLNEKKEVLELAAMVI